MKVLRVLIALIAWPLALAALAATAASQGGRFDIRLDVLTHFTPIYMAMAAAALVLAFLAPATGRLALIVISILSLAGGVALIGPEFMGGAGPRGGGDAKDQLKIIQFNGWSGNVKGAEALAWIKAESPDILVIEELQLRDELKAAGYHQDCRACGADIYSKAGSISFYRQKRRPGFPAYMGAATYRDARGEFTVVSVHRSWPTRFSRTVAQTEDLAAYLEGLPRDRVILTGDFNSTPWSFARKREDAGLGLIRRTHALATWPAESVSHNHLPAPFPYLPIDHLYAGAGWETVKVARGPKLGSDHYPIVVTLAPANSGAK